MNIVTVHNSYQVPGGEDEVFRAESGLLAERGHQVACFTADNAGIPELGRIRLLYSTFWNQAAYRSLRTLVEQRRASIVHFHNTFPLLSPAVYRAARDAGAAVVQTLHNFRMVCPNGLLLRDGRVCQDCVGKSFAWPGVAHACYRQDRLATAVAAGMVSYHRALGTWRRDVSVYIVMSRFAKSVFAAGGLPVEKLAVKPNFVHPDPGSSDGRGAYVVFSGRLSEEKGLKVLLEAWKRLKARAQLKLLGDGPLAGWIQQQVRDDPSMEWLGRLPREQALGVVRGAYLLVVPSLCYEGSPLAVLEAFAAGVPVVASRIGSLEEVIEHGRTGLHCAAGDPEDLAAALDRALAEPRLVAGMGRAARAEYEANYTASRNYERLIEIYEAARRHA